MLRGIDLAQSPIQPLAQRLILPQRFGQKPGETPREREYEGRFSGEDPSLWMMREIPGEGGAGRCPVPGVIPGRIGKTGYGFWFFLACIVHRTEKTRNMHLFCRNSRILRSSDLQYSGLLLARVSSPGDYEVAGSQRPTDAVCDRMVGSSRRTGFYVNREFSRREVIRDRDFCGMSHSAIPGIISHMFFPSPFQPFVSIINSRSTL